MPKILSVDPCQLRLPGGRQFGADPAKLQRQISRFGASIDTLPTLLVTRGQNGELLLIDGVTRATRVAKLRPGCPVRVEVVDELPDWNLSLFPTVGERLP